MKNRAATLLTEPSPRKPKRADRLERCRESKLTTSYILRTAIRGAEGLESMANEKVCPQPSGHWSELSGRFPDQLAKARFWPQKGLNFVAAIGDS